VNPLFFLVPGPIDRPTGGSRYDHRVVEGLRDSGLEVVVAELAGDFPGGDAISVNATRDALQGIGDGATVIVDGLVLAALPEVFAAQAARLCLIAIVHHPIADETGLDPLQQADYLNREQQALNQVQGVIATSAFTANRLAELGLYQGAVSIITPGCERKPLAIGSQGDDPQILCLGSLIPRKGQHNLIQALVSIRHLPWRCQCVGSRALDPTYARQLQAMIEHAGLAERVTLAGALEAKALDTVFNESDLFVLPSHYEGYGMVITEAIARGLPVITTTAGALPTTLPHGAGLAVEPNDTEALARAIEQVLTDPILRERLQTRAREAREELTDWAQTVSRFRTTLEAIQSHA